MFWMFFPVYRPQTETDPVVIRWCMVALASMVSYAVSAMALLIIEPSDMLSAQLIRGFFTILMYASIAYVVYAYLRVVTRRR